MARQFILIGRSRKTGKDEIICDRSVSVSEQIAKYKELARNRVNEDFESADLIERVPFKSSLKFDTQAEADAKAKAKVEAQKKSEADAKAKAKAKNKKGETKTPAPEPKPETATT
jgi:hypothetical protein